MGRIRSSAAFGAVVMVVLAAGCGSDGEAAAPATTRAASAPTGGATTVVAAPSLKLATTSLGSVIADGAGRTLYLFTNDTPGKASTCSGTCADSWPAYTAAAKPSVGAGLDASKVTLVAGSGGTSQIAYNGWPLYYFAADSAAGDVKGQKVSNVWYVLDAAGNAIGAGSSVPTTVKASSGGGDPYEY